MQKGCSRKRDFMIHEEEDTRLKLLMKRVKFKLRE